MVLLEESRDIKILNELFIKVEKHLPSSIENSIYYAKLKKALHPEIFTFTKEKLDLRDNLNFLRLLIGEPMSEKDIRYYLDSLKKQYNTVDNNVAIDYHIEATRVDFGVPVFVVIRRDVAYMKKFVFRFKKSDFSTGIEGMTQAGVPIVKEDAEVLSSESREERKKRYEKLMGGFER
jgi:hypothetical protein